MCPACLLCIWESLRFGEWKSVVRKSMSSAVFRTLTTPTPRTHGVSSRRSYQRKAAWGGPSFTELSDDLCPMWPWGVLPSPLSVLSPLPSEHPACFSIRVLDVPGLESVQEFELPPVPPSAVTFPSFICSPLGHCHLGKPPLNCMCSVHFASYFEVTSQLIFRSVWDGLLFPSLTSRLHKGRVSVSLVSIAFIRPPRCPSVGAAEWIYESKWSVWSN